MILLRKSKVRGRFLMYQMNIPSIVYESQNTYFRPVKNSGTRWLDVHGPGIWSWKEMEKPTQNDIKVDLLQFVKDNIVDDSGSIGYETPFREVGIDSFSIIQIVLFVERRYKVPVTEKDLVPENLNSIASIADFTYKHLA